MIALLSRFVRSRPTIDTRHLTITVFTRKECCCCHTALDLLKSYQRRYGFTIEEQDVDANPDLAARHGSMVPVIAINGKVRFKGVVNPVLLDRILLAEGRSD